MKRGAVMLYTIRRFQEADAEETARIIEKTLRISNGPDYSDEIIQEMIALYSRDGVLERAKTSHFYVVCDQEAIIGCGGIAGYMGRESESILVTVFLLPEYQGRGLGRLMMDVLERDPLFLRSSRVVIHSSITAHKFYQKLGYAYQGGSAVPDEEGCIRMEKRR